MGFSRHAVSQQSLPDAYQSSTDLQLEARCAVTAALLLGFQVSAHKPPSKPDFLRSQSPLFLFPFCINNSTSC